MRNFYQSMAIEPKCTAWKFPGICITNKEESIRQDSFDQVSTHVIPHKKTLINSFYLKSKARTRHKSLNLRVTNKGNICILIMRRKGHRFTNNKNIGAIIWGIHVGTICSFFWNKCENLLPEVNK